MKRYEHPQINLELLGEQDVIITSLPTLEHGIFNADDEQSESFGKYFPS